MTECARCGDCCENIPLNVTKKWAWQYTAALPWPGWDPDLAQRFYDNATFIRTHWHKVGGGGTGTRFSCDQFDAKTRLCLAHAARPPLCRDYPWYSEPPKANLGSPRCSFWADVPEEERPAEWVPVSPPSLRTAKPEKVLV